MSTPLRRFLSPIPLARVTAFLLAAVSVAAHATAQGSSVYRVTDLGQVPGQSSFAGVSASDISATGVQICGTSVWEPYVWDAANGMRALPKPAGERAAFASFVDSAGSSVGYAGLSAIPYYRAIHWDTAGVIQTLHQAPWVWSRPAGFNDAGQILLTAAIPNGSSTGAPHVFFGTAAGGFVDLTPNATSASGVALSEAGHIVFADSTGYHFMDPTGRTTVMGNAYAAQEVNDFGQVAGLANNSAARWTVAGGWQALAAPGLDIKRIGGIDSFGQVVAEHGVRYQTSPPRFNYYGHLYTDALGWSDLNSLVDPARFITVDHVAGLTDNGEIVAYGSIGPDNRAMLLEPRYVSTFGTGCAGTGGLTPKALIAGDPRGGQRLALLGAAARPFAQAAMLLAFASTTVPLPGGCTLLVDPSQTLSVPVTTNALGQAALALDLPVGVAAQSLWLQFGVLDAGAANGVVALSNGVRVDVR